SVLAAAKLGDATFLRTATDSMKIAAPTFIIPFAFVASPELMTFPNLTWAVVPAFAEVVGIQGAVSIAAYGYFLRNLNWWERLVFLAIAFAGFFNMMLHDSLYLYGGLAAFAVIAAWLVFTKDRPAVQPS
ncbi:MAG: hypothetical protein R3287_15940, partial [Anderseniella sp.]|nr:hypothetical protein [Anderseniella sp.]